MKTTTKQTHLYSNTDLRKLLIPIIIEQLLSSLMGTVDTMMVSNVGSAAISAVSLVDSINILVIQALSALAAGGAILCSQYIGSEKRDGAIRSAQQVLFVMTVLSVVLSAGCLIFRVPLLRVIFGAVEADVMKNSQVYFLFSLIFKFPYTMGEDIRIFHIEIIHLIGCNITTVIVIIFTESTFELFD